MWLSSSRPVKQHLSLIIQESRISAASQNASHQPLFCHLSMLLTPGSARRGSDDVPYPAEPLSHGQIRLIRLLPGKWTDAIRCELYKNRARNRAGEIQSAFVRLGIDESDAIYTCQLNGLPGYRKFGERVEASQGA
jgi:hypothetical protein